MPSREKADPTSSFNDSYGTMTNANDASASARDDASNTTGNRSQTTTIDEFHYTNRSNGNDSDPTSKYRYYVQIDDAIERIGTGTFQNQVLLAAGLCFMADAMEVLLLSFLSTVLKHEWNLSEREVDSIVAMVFAGSLVGTLVLGPAGDKFGRKPIFAITALIIAVSGVATAFCRNYLELVIARFFVGFGIGGLTVPFDTLGEFLPTASRGKNLLYIEFFWTFGTLSVPTLAYLTLDTSAENGGESHWQLFVILCSIPCFVSTILGIVLVPESPRWLLEQSSHLLEDEDGSEKALEILKSAALKNGISQKIIDEELFPPKTRLIISWKDVASIQKYQSPTMRNNMIVTCPTESHDNSNGSMWELFSTPSRKRLTFLLWGTWFGLGFLYYGVILAVSLVFTIEELGDQENGNNYAGEYGNNAGASSSYDFDFSAIFITASSEIFGLIVVLCTIDSIGRIPSQTVAYRIGGVATFVMGILYVVWINSADFFAAADNNDDSNKYYRYSLIGLAFIARMAMMGASCTTWISTSEMLTTDIRSTGHGAANAMARLGGFVSPYLITEGNSLGIIGALVLVISLVTAECAKRLPETAGKSMGDTTTPTTPVNATLMNDDDSEAVSVASSTLSAAKNKGLARIETMGVPATRDREMISSGPSTATAATATESATSYRELL